MQVWFEPDSNASPTAGSSPSPLLTLHGTARLAERLVQWRLADVADVAAPTIKAFGPGGRLLLRLNTGLRLDKDGRAFLAALDALVGTPQPHVQAGLSRAGGSCRAVDRPVSRRFACSA